MMKNPTDDMMHGPDIADAHRWGFAALPEGVEYPYNGEDNPMTLIGQYHFGEGMLYLFADIDYFFGDLDADAGHLGEWDSSFYSVIYAPERTNLHLHRVLDENGEPALPAAAPVGDNDLLPASYEFFDEISQDYPDCVVLMQLEEDDELGLRFYDCGNLTFLIRPEELEARRFDKVKCVLYSY